MLITLSKMNRSLCTIDMAEARHQKNDKKLFFENLAKIANLGKIKMKILDAKFFYGKHFILTPFKGTENGFSIFCLVCATELTQYTTYGKIP